MYVFSIFILNISLLWCQNNDTIQLKEAVVTETKFAQSKEKSGKITEVISNEQLEKKAGQSVAQLLNQVAGIEMVGSNSSGGKNVSYFIRGGKNRQVLVLIDGIQITDASGINTEFDLRLLPVNQIESIEIMKGASSTLYGSGAATAVINIILKKASKKSVNGTFSTTFGTQTTAEKTSYKPYHIQQNIGLSGTLQKFRYQTFISRNHKDGISEAEGKNFESDPTTQANFLQTIGYQAAKNFDVKAFAQWDYLKNNYDVPFDNFSNQDIVENVAKTKQYRLGFQSDFKHTKGELVLKTAYTNTERNYTELNSWTATKENWDYFSRNFSADVFHKYKIQKELYNVTGVQHQFSDMEMIAPFIEIKNEKAKFNQIEPYTSFVFESAFGLNINVGVRLNHHSNYGNHFVYNANPSFTFKNIPLKLISSISSAYVSPSLFQLYSNYGNEKLTPEKNQTIEAGFETNLGSNQLKINTVAYYRDEKNAIGFSPLFVYENIVGEYKVRGIEVTTSYKIVSNLKIDGNYTFTEPAQALQRLIPKHKANISLDFTHQKSSFLVSYMFVDKRFDSFYDMTTYATTNANLSSYSLTNFFYSTQFINDKLTFKAAVTNIFNEKYTENIGYSTLGRNFLVGFNLMF